MTMSTFKRIAVTNRKLSRFELPEQIDRIMEISRTASNIEKPDMIILREKDLSEKEYEILAAMVIEKCRNYDIECILHTYINVAQGLNCRKIHLPVSLLKENSGCLKYFDEVGASIHCVEEAVWAEKNGAAYVTAGHIFETDCKEGVPPRGLIFLNEVCNSVKIPVYAIGGIDNEKIALLKDIDVAGVCIMSGYMKL